MHVLASPASTTPRTNPFVALLHGELLARGLVVEKFSRRALLSRPDIVHVHWPEQLVRTHRARDLIADAATHLVLIAVARRRGSALIWTAHNLQPHDREHPRLMGAFLALFAVLVDVVIPLSAGSRAPLIARYRGLKRTPFAVVPHGHYRDVYPPAHNQEGSRRRLGLDPSRRTLLTLGAVRPYKNVPQLVRAFVERQALDAQLAIVGRVSSDGLRQEIEAARRGDERVHLHLAAVSAEDVSSWHAAADVVVLAYDTASSLNSGAALLALSLDRPVVMPDGPSARELRDQIGHQWVKPVRGSVDDLMIAALSASPPADPRPSLDHLAWGEVAEKTISAYELAISRKRRRSRRHQRLLTRIEPRRGKKATSHKV
jgi:beta-1,4-mannosyltransferase